MECQQKIQRDAKSHYPKIMALSLSMVVASISGCNETPLPGFSESLAQTESPVQVISTSPESEAIDIDLNISIQATFNTSIDSATIDETTFIVRQDTTSLSGSFSHNDSSVTFNPSTELLRNSLIHTTITSDVTDIEGNKMNQDYNWNFITRGPTAYEIMPPLVVLTDPYPGSSEVPVNTNINAHFNKALNPSTINSSTFLLRANNSSVPGSVSYKDSIATFNPSSSLQEGTIYIATITTAVEDLYGNFPETNYNWNFITKEVDRTPPRIVSTYPRDDDDDVPVNIRITATFSEEMNPASINKDTFRIYYKWRSAQYRKISGTVSYTGTVATFIPKRVLHEDRDYIAVISPSVTDLAGNKLGKTYQWNFETDDD